MRWLGIAAAVGALGAAVVGIILFRRLGLGFQDFALVGAGTAAFMAFTVLFGVVSVRLMMRREEEADAEEARAAARKRPAPTEKTAGPDPGSEVAGAAREAQGIRGRKPN